MSTLRNGEEFSLRELFSHDNKIVIPDLQRDYCWGDSAYIEQEKSQKELVSGFVGDYLLTSFKEKSSTSKDLMLGLVYGYEEPFNCFNICDGQQRITTLFLLLGMVNRYSDGELYYKGGYTNPCTGTYEYTVRDYISTNIGTGSQMTELKIKPL